MAVGDVDLGATYISMLRGDVVRDSYTTFTPTFPLLPEDIAPLHKQMRLFIDGTEQVFKSGRETVPPTSDYYTISTDTTPSAGVRCWGVRWIFAPRGYTSDNSKIAHVALWDENGDQITMDGSWTNSREEGTLTQLADAVWTTDPTTGHIGPQDAYNTVTTTNFPSAIVVNKIGWTRAYSESNTDTVTTMRIEVNTGTPTDPVWTLFGDSQTDQVYNTTLGTPPPGGGVVWPSFHFGGLSGMSATDYPALQDPIVAEEDCIWFDWSLNRGDPRDLDVPTPILTCVPSVGLDTTTKRATLLRETRQDKPWAAPTNGAYAHGYALYWYFEQIRFICQELCLLPTMAELVGVPVRSLDPNDYTEGSQSVIHDATVEATFSFASLELLEWAPAAGTDAQDQLVVELSTANDGSAAWRTVTYAAVPSGATEYKVVGTDVVLGGNTSDYVRIRRNTRKDQYWFDLRGVLGTWNSAAVDMVQRQARFMIEEACRLPQFYNENPLSQSIFPRAWNWFRYTGTRASWTIPGLVWGGDGNVIVYVNDLELTDPDDYTVEGVALRFASPPSSSSDSTSVGVGAGGWGGGVGGGGSGDTLPDSPVSRPGIEAPPFPWSSGVPLDAGVSVSVGCKSASELSTGNWEGGTNVSFSQGNATDSSQFGSNPMMVRVTVTEANRVSDGVGGYFPAGAQDVYYINKFCDPQGDSRFYSVAEGHYDGSTWTTDEGSPAFGCLQPGGANAAAGIYGLSNATAQVTADSPQSLQLWDALNLITARPAGGVVDDIPYMGAWREFQEQGDHAFSQGWVSEAGFTGDDFEVHLDPYQSFTGFDDPAP